ncbi:MAG: hypothetical protein V7640_3093 [Betaproteobacteria bacterium]
MLSRTDSVLGPPAQRVQVGEWAVQPALNQVSSAGKTVKLEPKVMSVLMYLAERPGESRKPRSAAFSGVVWVGCRR